MKKQISLLLTFFAMAIMVHAQAPNAIPYQGVARNSSGSILASQAIRLRLTIRDITAGGTIVYQETQAVTTSTLGLFNVNIGLGTPVTGTLAGVNWGGGAKFLQVEMDPTGGTNYISMGTTQLNSVPYALFAGGTPAPAGWSLTGNSGTVDGTNFIGTSDNQPLNFRINNQNAGRLDLTLRNAFYGYLSGNSNNGGYFNSGIGFQALNSNTSGYYNSAVGVSALRFNTTGTYNTAVGPNSLYSNTTASNNAAIGANALYYNTTGFYNTANGVNALFTNTTGYYNTSLGANSLYSTTTGIANTSVGAYSLYFNTTGIYNNASGAQALYNNTTGSYNNAIGVYALKNNTTGSYNNADGDSALFSNTTGNLNTALGYGALSINTTGSNNTGVGDSANVATGALYNATAIGYKAIAPASNTIQLGNTTIDSVMAGALSANTKLVVPRIRITGGALAANSVLTSDALGNATWQPSSLSGWSLTGNTGTVDGTNFIGTTDNTPLNFRVNNIRAGRINPLLANTFFGVQSGGLITTGGFNTANGNKALYSTTSGAYNSAHGDSALYANTTGSFNTAHGYAALASNTTGSNNTAIGDSADVTTGALTNATAIGYNAKVSANNTIQLGNTTIDSVMAGTLSANTKLVVPRLKITGGTLAANNILTSDALGNATWQPAAPSGWSLSGNAGINPANNFIGTTDNQPFNIRVNNLKAGRIDSASANSFYGLLAGGSNSTGKGNTAIGDSALYFNTTGSFITAIGDSAGVTTDGLVNATAIGHSAKVSASNTIQLGNAATDSVMAGSAADSTKLIIPRLRVTAGTPAVGQVLTATDANGNAKWQTLPSGFPTATATGQMVYWNGSAWIIVPAGTRGQTLTFCEGVPTWGACPAITATVTTTAPANIFSNKATGGGNVTYNGDAPIITSGVVWSTSAIPATGSPTGTFSTDGVTGSGPYSPYTSAITGLTYHTTYFVRAYATNSVGTAYGTQLSFQTGDTTASLTTTASSNLGSTTVTTGGTIVNNGGNTITTSGVVYSTSTIPATGAPSGTFTTDGTTSGNWSSNLTGLTPGTPYYARAYATNGIGTSYGNQITFTTTTTPTVSTTSPSSTTSTTSNPGGNISSNGGATVTASGVVYSTSPTPAPSGHTGSLGGGFTVTTDGNTSTWTSSLTGLLGSTTYYAYAYATNNVGTSYGSQVSFTTSAPSAPTVTTTAAISNITATTASSGGTITSNGGATITARGVVWSTSNTAPSGSPGSLIGFGFSTDGTGTGSFSSSLTGLTGSTKYYVYAYATNSVGTTYGPQVSFTTTITVGDSYQGGIVFYVTGSPGAQTGLIVSTADQNASIAWYTGTLVATGATGTAIGTGSANTATIVGLQASGNAAATAVAYTGGGYNDWYLPSKDALNVLYPLRASFGIGMSNSAYWSSSEVDVNTAWGQAFGFGGAQSATSKNTLAAVRAIRSF